MADPALHHGHAGHSDARVATCSTRQHGLITHPQSLDVGLTERQIQYRNDTGQWVRVDHRVYRVAAAPHTWHTRLLAPCLSTGGLASHRSAAALWDIGGIAKGPPEITVPRDRRYARRDVRVHESRDLHLAEPRTVEGIPVTGVARTLIDLGAVVRRTTVEDATIDAVDRRLVTWPALLDSFVRHARRGRDGVGAMRWVIERHLDQALPQSRLELRFLRLLERHGLPLPERQVELADHEGFIARVDFLFRRARVVIEVDGRSVHARRQALARDHARRNRLSLAGWTVLVFLWEDVVGQPDAVVQRVRAGLDVRRAA